LQRKLLVNQQVSGRVTTPERQRMLGIRGGTRAKRFAEREGLIMTADGNWSLVIATPIGERQATLSVKADGGTLTGSQMAEGNSADIFDGTVDGNAVTWKVSITDPMPMTLEFSGAVNGDELNGTVNLGAFGSAPFSGKRT
jgi:hypothetical protein